MRVRREAHGQAEVRLASNLWQMGSGNKLLKFLDIMRKMRTIDIDCLCSICINAFFFILYEPTAKKTMIKTRHQREKEGLMRANSKQLIQLPTKVMSADTNVPRQEHHNNRKDGR